MAPTAFLDLNPELARSTLTLLAELAFRGGVILAAALVASWLLRRQSATVRHGVWVASICALLLLPVLTAVLPSWQVLPADFPSGLRTTIVDGPDAAAGFPMTWPTPERVDRTSEPESAPVVRQPAAGMQHAIEDTPVATQAARSVKALAVRMQGMHWSEWLLLAWIGGFCAVLAWQFTGTIGVFHLARRARAVQSPAWLEQKREAMDRLGIRRPVDLRICSRIDMPVTWGGRRPLVLLPTAARHWDADRLEYVLLHELAHVRRFDHTTQAVARLACALYWFNPLVWLAARNLRLEREQACDDEVLLVGGKPSIYARHLIEIARAMQERTAPLPIAALAMARPSQLEGRVLAILDPKRRRSPMKASHSLLSLAVVILCALPIASAARQAPPPPVVEPPPPAPAVVHAPAPTVEPPSFVAEPALAPPAAEPLEPSADLQVAPDTIRNRERVIAAFVEALEDPDEEVRRQAIYALAEIDATSAVDAIGRVAADDQSREVRRAALHALSELDPSAAIPLIQARFKTEADPELRRQMLYVIAESGDPAMISTVRAALSDDDPDVRKSALMAAAELDDEQAIPLVESALDDPEPDNRRMAIHALLELADPASISDRAVDALIRAADSDDAQLRANAVMALAEIDSEAAVPVLAKAASDPDADVRRYAVIALAESNSDEAAAVLIAATSDGDADVRKYAVHALAEKDDEASMEALLRTVSDADPEVRRAAIWALVDRGANVPPDALIGALDDDEPEVRRMAIWALAQGAVDEATRARVAGGLAGTVKNDPDVEVRRAAVYALAEIGGDDAVDALTAALKDADPAVRRAATAALAELVTRGRR